MLHIHRTRERGAMDTSGTRTLTVIMISLILMVLLVNVRARDDPPTHLFLLLSAFLLPISLLLLHMMLPKEQDDGFVRQIVLRSISSVLVIGTQSNYLLDGVSPIIARISSSTLGMLHVSIHEFM